MFCLPQLLADEVNSVSDASVSGGGDTTEGERATTSAQAFDARHLALIADAVPPFFASASAAAAACSMAAGDEDADVGSREEEGRGRGDDDDGGLCVWRDEGEAKLCSSREGVWGDEFCGERGGRRAPERVREWKRSCRLCSTTSSVLWPPPKPCCKGGGRGVVIKMTSLWLRSLSIVPYLVPVGALPEWRAAADSECSLLRFRGRIPRAFKLLNSDYIYMNGSSGGGG